MLQLSAWQFLCTSESVNQLAWRIGGSRPWMPCPVRTSWISQLQMVWSGKICFKMWSRVWIRWAILDKLNFLPHQLEPRGSLESSLVVVSYCWSRADSRHENTTPTHPEIYIYSYTRVIHLREMHANSCTFGDNSPLSAFQLFFCLATWNLACHCLTLGADPCRLCCCESTLICCSLHPFICALLCFLAFLRLWPPVCSLFY